jgi:hypothetical protein
MKLLGQIEKKLLKNVPLPDLVRICRFYADPKFNMAARANVIRFLRSRNKNWKTRQK